MSTNAIAGTATGGREDAGASLQASFLTPDVEYLTYRGYEQRVIYDPFNTQWKCLYSEPAFWLSDLTSHGWKYHTDRAGLIARVKATVDCALDCVGIADKAEWDAKYRGGELTIQAWVAARWGAYERERAV